MLFKTRFFLFIFITLLSLTQAWSAEKKTSGAASKAQYWALKNTSSLVKGLQELVDENNKSQTEIIKKNKLCYKNNAFIGNCVRVVAYLEDDDENWHPFSYDNTFLSAWYDKRGTNKDWFTGTSYGVTNEFYKKLSGGKTIPDQLAKLGKDATFKAFVGDLKLLHDDVDKTKHVATEGADNLGHAAMTFFHSEFAFLSSILRGKEDKLDGNHTPKTTILHIISTNSPCAHCGPALERLLTMGPIKEKICGRSNSNLHIIYTYLKPYNQGPKFVDTPKGPLTFNSKSPQFMGIDFTTAGGTSAVSSKKKNSKKGNGNKSAGASDNDDEDMGVESEADEKKGKKSKSAKGNGNKSAGTSDSDAEDTSDDEMPDVSDSSKGKKPNAKGKGKKTAGASSSGAMDESN